MATKKKSGSPATRRRKSSKKPTPRTASKGKARKPSTAEILASLDARLAIVEKNLEELAAGAARQPAARQLALTGVAATVDVKLKKVDGSADLTRVTYEGKTVVLPGAKSGVIEDVQEGSYITLWIEVAGNSGSKASFTVENGLPSPTPPVTIPADRAQWIEPRALLVKES